MHTLSGMAGAHGGASTTGRAPRKDALRNDRLVLDAALAVFGESGRQAGMEEIAARAGVGVGTIYRRFPSKDALLEALAVQLRAEMEQAMTAAIAADDARRGLLEFLEFVGEFDVTKRRLTPVVTERLGDRSITADMSAMVAALTENAIRSGSLAPDVTADDILALVRALRGGIEQSEGGESWRRFLRIHRCAPATELLRRSSAVDEVARMPPHRPPRICGAGGVSR